MRSILRHLIPVFVVLAIIGSLGLIVVYKLGEPVKKTESIEGAQREQGVPVEVVRPARLSFSDYLLCDGNVAADVRAVLRANVEEVVQSVNARAGEEVEAGQMLVQFRTDDLDAAIGAAQAAYDEAASNS